MVRPKAGPRAVGLGANFRNQTLGPLTEGPSSTTIVLRQAHDEAPAFGARVRRMDRLP
jgi:hypothetical protein